jgi:hypothetical protein
MRPKVKGYQKFFNNQFGYRKDYQASFFYYMKQYLQRYIVDWFYYSDGVPVATTKRVEKRGPRGGHTGQYHTIDVPASKPESISLKITFLSWTWLAFGFKFSWSSYVYPVIGLSVFVDKPNWMLTLKVKNNTA